MADKEFLSAAKILNKIIGFPALTNYKKLHGTKIETFGNTDSSMWFVTYHRKSDGTIGYIEVNTTYFESKAVVARAINGLIEKGYTIDQISSLYSIL